VREAEHVDTDRAVELGSGPKRDTDSVERGEVRAEWRPLEVELSPFLNESA
jgi:hypothetical protein